MYLTMDANFQQKKLCNIIYIVTKYTIDNEAIWLTHYKKKKKTWSIL